jgi:gliding motility-associated-like protein
MKFLNLNIFLRSKHSLIFVFLFLNSFFCFNQLNIINSRSPEQLISEILVGNGVKVSNIKFKGSKNSIGEFSYFDVLGSNNLGLDKGILLSTGNVFSAKGINIKDSTSNLGSNLSDNELDLLIKTTGKKTTDATYIEFDFVPMSDSIQFKYIFASEEYPEFNCSSFNDVFAFFLSGPNPLGGSNFINQNLAIVPGTVNTNVSVNTINSGTVSVSNNESICNAIDLNWKTYSSYFVQNYPNQPKSDQITFDGYTIPLIAKSAVKCGETYHLKIAIADVGDQNYDSGVFLLANSLFSNIITAETKIQKNDLTIFSDSNIVENCHKGILTFKLAKKVNQNTIVKYSLSGNSTNGVDYQNLNNEIIIPANNDSVQLIISPINDNITEANETLNITYNAGGCAGIVTKSFIIRDKPLDPITNFKYDSLICINSEDKFVLRSNGFVKGGVFNSNSIDLNLNSSTGKISPGLSKVGTYEVTYKVNPTNVCEAPGQSTIKIEIKQSLDPITTFSYSSPLCQSNSISYPNTSSNFTNGGIFYSKTDLKIDSLTGKIDLLKSSSGKHKIYYTFKKNECFNYKIDSTEIEIVGKNENLPSFSYSNPVCILDANPLPILSSNFMSGGIFKTDSIKLVFKNNLTGEIDIQLTPIGTYNIYYELKNITTNCTETSNKTYISIINNSLPKVTFDYDKTICSGGGNKFPKLIKGFTMGGTFKSDSKDLIVDSLTGELKLNESKKGIYQIRYKLRRTNCNNELDTIVSIKVDTLILKKTDFKYNSPVCITSTNPLPTGNFDIGGEFTAPQGVTISKTNGRINLLGSLPGTYDITYTIKADQCFAQSIGKSSITIESNNAPVVNFSYERPMCLNSLNTTPILPVNFTKGGKFKTTETDISVNNITGKIDLSNAIGGKTYKIEYEILSNSCGGTGLGNTEVFIANIKNPDTDFNYKDSLFCTNTILLKPNTNTSFEPEGVFKSPSKGLIIDSKTGEIDFSKSDIGYHEIMYKTAEKSCIKADSTIRKIKISKLPVVSIKTNNPICVGDTLKLFGPTYQKATYSWIGPNNFVSNDREPFITKINANQEGIYKLIIKENNCVDSTNIVVDVKDLEKITFLPDKPFCKNDTTLYRIKASLKHGIWSDKSFKTEKNDSSILLFRPSELILDSIKLNYVTKLGCGGYGELKIINNSIPQTKFDLSSKEGCAPVDVKLLIPPNDIDSCQWYIDNTYMKFSKDSIIKFSKLGVFNVKVINYKKGCSSFLQKDTILKIYSVPKVDFNPNDTTLSMFNPVIHFQNKSINATNYKWEFNDGSSSIVKNPFHRFPLNSTDYFVTLTASQKGFCEESKTILVNIPTELTVYAPNTFTPNNDKLNEEFLPIISNAIDPLSYTLIIYNRWGQVVFISHDKSVGWKGTYDGKFCVDGVYTWKIDFIDSINNKKHYYVGNVTIIK